MGSVSVQSQASSRGERLSAFVDGESFDGSGDISQFLSGFTQRDRAAWSDYHLIGDALRSDDLAASPAASSAFMNAFSARFEAPGEHVMPCHEFCGTGHAGMWAKVKVVEKQSFRDLASGKRRLSCVE